MGAFEIDERRAPLIVVTFPPIFTIEEYRALFERYDELARRSKRVAWLIDFQRFNPVFAPASLRRACAEVFEQHRAVLAPVTVAEARVVHDIIARGILTAFDWVTPGKWPIANVRSFAEAELFLQKRLGPEAADGPVP